MKKSLKRTPQQILEGPILKTLLALALPSMLAFLFHTAFNFIDRFFVSRLGQVEFGALGMAFTLQSILIAIGVGTGTGVSSLIARLVGAGKTEEADNAAEHALLIVLALSIITTTIGPLLSRPFFTLLGASPEMLPHILSYINIILFGSSFKFFSMIGNGILRGEGNTVTPMRVMMTGTLVNIILDPILIFGLGPFPALGVKGAAIATVAGRVTSSLLIAGALFSSKNVVNPNLKSFFFQSRFIKGIFAVGAPSIITQLSHSLGLSLLFILLRPYGDAAKAAFTMGFTYQQVAVMPIFGIAQATLTMAGQNYGARNFHRLQTITHRALGFSIALLTFCALIFIFARLPLSQIFSKNSDMVSIGKNMLLIFSLGFPFLAVRIIISSFFQGLGMGVKSLILNLVQMVLFSIPLALLFSLFFGLNGIWSGMTLANMLTALLSYTWSARTLKQLEA